MSEQPAKYYDDLFKTNYVYGLHYEKCHYYTMWQALADMLNKKERVVDLGCGPGQFAHLLYDMGFKDYIGIDFSRTAVDMAIEKFNGIAGYHFIYADLKSCPIPVSKQYVACEFLEHVMWDLELLKKLNGSYIVASVPKFDADAHVGFFSTQQEVKERYDLDFDVLKPLGDFYYIFKGKIGD